MEKLPGFFHVLREGNEDAYFNTDYITDFGYDPEKDETWVNFVGEEGTRRFKHDITEEIKDAIND